MSSYSTFEYEDILFIKPSYHNPCTKQAISARYTTFIGEGRQIQLQLICKGRSSPKARKDNQWRKEDQTTNKYHILTNRYAHLDKQIRTSYKKQKKNPQSLVGTADKLHCSS